MALAQPCFALPRDDPADNNDAPFGQLTGSQLRSNASRIPVRPRAALSGPHDPEAPVRPAPLVAQRDAPVCLRTQVRDYRAIAGFLGGRRGTAPVERRQAAENVHQGGADAGGAEAGGAAADPIAD